VVMLFAVTAFASSEEAVDLGGITITFGNWGELSPDLKDPNSRESL